MNLFEQFKSSLKPIEVEEVADLFFFRPLAFLFVKIFYNTPLTPNHISLISLVVGIAAGVSMAVGTITSVTIGGVLYILSTAIDCSDGMIARLKKNGTKVGRIVDGVVDYGTTISVYVGLVIGLDKLVASNQIELPLNPWVFTILMGAAHAFHSMVTDHYRNMYESQVFNKSLDPESQIREFEEEKIRLSKENGSKVEKFIVNIYIKYCKIQAGKHRNTAVRYKPESYERYNRTLVFLWNLIGPSQHIFILAISLILFKPIVFFWFVVVFANVWTIILFAIQKHFDKKLEVKNQS